ncbi:MAG TPA: succinate dehydrogenase assembly factor 2 [Gammaproteobacteria bacterium]|nr:succinate dehydrogenase assembly factor 2 [Gammaproteobacteria bacterium]
MSELSRLRWQCRRGMKELDVLLESYLNDKFNQALPAEQLAFAGLLELPDPTLMAYIVGRASPEAEEQRRVIDVLRRASGV